ncbi:MAG: hypothetical protein FWD48_03115 [Oscillospiraceae bacterium]|nr:hypothetical protein [Oscillospiraceae bacterium]
MRSTRNVSYLSIILFIITAWFTVFFFWNFIEFNNHVSGILRAGNLSFRGNAHEIITYYMNGCAPYLFYALVMGTLGWLLIKLRPKFVVETTAIPVIPVCNCEEEDMVE